MFLFTILICFCFLENLIYVYKYIYISTRFSSHLAPSFQVCVLWVSDCFFHLKKKTSQWISNACSEARKPASCQNGFHWTCVYCAFCFFFTALPPPPDRTNMIVLQKQLGKLKSSKFLDFDMGSFTVFHNLKRFLLRPHGPRHLSTKRLFCLQKGVLGNLDEPKMTLP